MRLARRTAIFRLLPPTNKKMVLLNRLWEEARNIYNISAMRLPSWGTNLKKGSLYKTVRLPEGILHSQCVEEMVGKVIENWKSEKAQGSSTIPRLKDIKYILRLHYQRYDFEKFGDTWFLKIRPLKRNKGPIILPILGSNKKHVDSVADLLHRNPMISRAEEGKRRKSTRGSAELIYDPQEGILTLHAVVNAPAPQPYIPTDVIMGTDLGKGIPLAAVLIKKSGRFKYTVLNQWLLGKDWMHWRNRARSYVSLLQREQGRKGAGGLRDVISRKRDTLQKQYACITVDAAKEAKAEYVIDNIHQFTKIRDWPFASQQQFVVEQCIKKGVPYRWNNPPYTSIRCPRCGYISDKNRTGRRFKCGNCGYDDNADLVGALNAALSLRPNPMTERFISLAKLSKRRPAGRGRHAKSRLSPA